MNHQPLYTEYEEDQIYEIQENSQADWIKESPDEKGNFVGICGCDYSSINVISFLS